MATFQSHGPCPRCHSRDNLASYDDGSKWCFGCSYYVPPQRTIANSRKEEVVEDVATGGVLDSTSRIPARALKWLKQYGVSDEEIKLHGIKWCESKHSLILGRQFRYFGDKEGHPKAWTIPGREGDEFVFNPFGPETLVFVEDFISALKVGRCCSGYPLFGSHIPDKALNRACETFSKVGVWLDLDKCAEGAKAVLRASAYGFKNVRQVITECDPKEYGTETIIRHLKSKGLL